MTPFDSSRLYTWVLCGPYATVRFNKTHGEPLCIDSMTQWALLGSLQTNLFSYSFLATKYTAKTDDAIKDTIVKPGNPKSSAKSVSPV